MVKISLVSQMYEKTNKQTKTLIKDVPRSMILSCCISYILHQINNYYTLLYAVCTVWYLGHDDVGCYKGNFSKPIRSLEGTDPILDGSYHSRECPIAKCAVVAIRAGYRIFAVQDGGRCVASATAPQTFNSSGESNECNADGEGGQGANQVYIIKGNQIIMFALILYMCQGECTECKGLINATGWSGFLFGNPLLRWVGRGGGGHL